MESSAATIGGRNEYQVFLGIPAEPGEQLVKRIPRALHVLHEGRVAAERLFRVVSVARVHFRMAVAHDFLRELVVIVRVELEEGRGMRRGEAHVKPD